jgi:uncharacterized protein Usg
MALFYFSQLRKVVQTYVYRQHYDSREEMLREMITFNQVENDFSVCGTALTPEQLEESVQKAVQKYAHLSDKEFAQFWIDALEGLHMAEFAEGELIDKAEDNSEYKIRVLIGDPSSK